MIAERSAFISARRAAELLGVHRNRIPAVAAAGKVLRKEVPGLRVLYCRADIERIAADSLKGGESAAESKSAKGARKGRTSGQSLAAKPVARPTRQIA